MTGIYDVERETEFNREKLKTAIPNRLEELLGTCDSEEPHRDVVCRSYNQDSAERPQSWN